MCMGRFGADGRRRRNGRGRWWFAHPQRCIWARVECGRRNVAFGNNRSKDGREVSQGFVVTIGEGRDERSSGWVVKCVHDVVDAGENEVVGRGKKIGRAHV